MAEQSPPTDEDEGEQLSPQELAELDKIKDPELRKRRAMEIRMQKEALQEQMRRPFTSGEDLRDGVRQNFRA